MTISNINKIVNVSMYIIALSIGGICLSFMIGCTNTSTGVIVLITSLVVSFLSAVTFIVGVNKMDKL